MQQFREEIILQDDYLMQLQIDVQQDLLAQELQELPDLLLEIRELFAHRMVEL